MTEDAAQPEGNGDPPQLQVVITLNANGSVEIAGIQDMGSFLMLLELARMEVVTKVTSGRIAQELLKEQCKKKIITPDSFGIAPKGGH